MQLTEFLKTIDADYLPLFITMLWWYFMLRELVPLLEKTENTKYSIAPPELFGAFASRRVYATGE